MSRLSDLLRQVERVDPSLANDIRAEVRTLSERRPFGLNYEPHVPEAVDLPGRTVRRGDKVRALPARDGTGPYVPKGLWIVARVELCDSRRTAMLHRAVAGSDSEEVSWPVEDLVVVAEFRDTIYPGLMSAGSVRRGPDDAPCHTVINAENFHALEALTYTHAGRIDAIYIDPPYNTGARDWKYSNDYVDADDAYRHSKWLAMMEHRLTVARQLLNPDDSVLIVTIDEKEYLRLGLLLQQLFPAGRLRMISSVINPKGNSRPNDFSRTDEYVFVLMFGTAGPKPELDLIAPPNLPVEFGTLRRRDLSSVRHTRPRQFYPIFVEVETGRVVEIGDPLDPGEDRGSVLSPTGCSAVFPVRPDGTEMNWGVTAPELRSRFERGYVKVGRHEPNRPQTFVVSYLKSGPIADIEAGRAEVVGRGEVNGDVEARYRSAPTKVPTTNWQRPAHDAERHGSIMIREMLGRAFPFPKSLYAVEDALRFFVSDKPQAVVLDFFSGSGTTAHAVMRLNKQDGGRRQCISVTNNEVSAEEAKRLRAKGLRPGDPEWEALGICDYITKPRIEAAITGRTPTDQPIKGEYKFTDEFPMSDGFEANAEFFTLTYESPRQVAHHRSFERVAPLLWLRAGACGRRIETPAADYDVTDTYGVLFDLDASHGFVEAVTKAVDAGSRIRLAFVVTDDDRAYQTVCAELPDSVEPVRLYSSYLTSFTLSGGVR